MKHIPFISVDFGVPLNRAYFEKILEFINFNRSEEDKYISSYKLLLKTNLKYQGEIVLGKETTKMLSKVIDNYDIEQYMIIFQKSENN